MKFSTLLIAPVLALGATAQILNRDFAIEGCVGLSTVLNPALGILGSAITGQLFTTESACAVSCFILSLRTNSMLISLGRLPSTRFQLRLLPRRSGP